METRREYVGAGVIFSLLRLQNTHIRLSSRRVELDVLRASAAEGASPSPVTDCARTGEGKETPPRKDSARNRIPLRAVVSERAVLESYRVLEPALRGTNAPTTNVRLALAP